MANQQPVRVHVKVVGFVDRKMHTAEFDLEVPEGTSLKKLLARADKSGAVERKVIKKILGLPRAPTLLVNGQAVDLPGGLKAVVKTGDEVALLTPVGGG